MGNNCYIKRKDILQVFIYCMYIYIIEFRKRKIKVWLINDWSDFFICMFYSIYIIYDSKNILLWRTQLEFSLKLYVCKDKFFS